MLAGALVGGGALRNVGDTVAPGFLVVVGTVERVGLQHEGDVLGSVALMLAETLDVAGGVAVGVHAIGGPLAEGSCRRRKRRHRWELRRCSSRGGR
eukprot:12250272-Alexandrium_andersonii.AAC.1